MELVHRINVQRRTLGLAPLTAAFGLGGGNDSRNNYKHQLRDRVGKWIEMGGIVRWSASFGDMASYVGKVVGFDGEYASVQVTDRNGSPFSGDTVKVHSSQLEVVEAKAHLPGSSTTPVQQKRVVEDGRATRVSISSNVPGVSRTFHADDKDIVAADDLEVGDRVIDTLGTDGSGKFSTKGDELEVIKKWAPAPTGSGYSGSVTYRRSDGSEYVKTHDRFDDVVKSKSDYLSSRKIEGKVSESKPASVKHEQTSLQGYTELSGDLSEEEDTALEHYSSYSSAGYTSINQHLRTGGESQDDSKYAGALRNVLNKSTLVENTKLYRGARSGSWLGNKLEPGTVLQDKGFLSTSADPEVADNFATRYTGKPDQESVLFEIEASKGAHAFDLTNWSGDVTEAEVENEVLLPDSAQLSVISDERRADGMRVIRTKLLLTGAKNEPKAGPTGTDRSPDLDQKSGSNLPTDGERVEHVVSVDDARRDLTSVGQLQLGDEVFSPDRKNVNVSYPLYNVGADDIYTVTDPWEPSDSGASVNRFTSGSIRARNNSTGEEVSWTEFHGREVLRATDEVKQSLGYESGGVTSDSTTPNSSDAPQPEVPEPAAPSADAIPSDRAAGSRVDADGRQLAVGDRVVSTTDSRTYTIKKFEGNGTGALVTGDDGKTYGRKLRKLRHQQTTQTSSEVTAQPDEQPPDSGSGSDVISAPKDADGRELAVGQSVVSTTDGQRYTIKKFEGNGTGAQVVGEDGKTYGRKLRKLRLQNSNSVDPQTEVKDPDSRVRGPRPVDSVPSTPAVNPVPAASVDVEPKDADGKSLALGDKVTDANGKLYTVKRFQSDGKVALLRGADGKAYGKKVAGLRYSNAEPSDSIKAPLALPSTRTVTAPKAETVPKASQPLDAHWTANKAAPLPAGVSQLGDWKEDEFHSAVDKKLHYENSRLTEKQRARIRPTLEKNLRLTSPSVAAGLDYIGTFSDDPLESMYGVPKNELPYAYHVDTGYNNGHHIHINESLLNGAKQEQQKLKRGIKIGSMPKMGNNVRIEDYIFSHEYGHHIQRNTLDFQSPEFQKKFWSELASAFDIKPTYFGNDETVRKRWVARNKETLAKKVSSYGSTSPSELVSEIWGAYVAGGTSADPDVFKVGQMIHGIALGGQPVLGGDPAVMGASTGGPA